MITNSKHRMNVRTEMRTKVKDVKLDRQLRFSQEVSRVGNIYVGRIFLEGEGDKKVIIKEIPLERNGFMQKGNYIASIQESFQALFAKLKIPYTVENLAKLYNKTIINLRAAGIPLPKMKAIVRDGKLLLISQYFGNATTRKLRKLDRAFYLDNLSPKEMKEYLDLSIATINAGYIPTIDFLEYFKGENKTGFVPLDIDLQVYYELKYRTKNADYIDELFWQLFINLTHMGQADYIKYGRYVLSRIKDRDLANALRKKFLEGNKKYF